MPRKLTRGWSPAFSPSALHGWKLAMADDIQVAVDAAGIAVVTLNRPEKRNVVSLAMWRGARRDLPRLRATQRRPRGDPDRRRRSFLRRRRHLGVLQGAQQRGGRARLRRGGPGGDAGHHRPAAADDRRGAWLRRGRRVRAGTGLRPARGRRDDADGHPGRAAVHRLRHARLQPAAARGRVGECQAGALLGPLLPAGRLPRRWD